MLAPAKKGRMMTMTAVLVVVVLVPQPLLTTSVMLAPTKGRVMAMMMMAVGIVKRRRILTWVRTGVGSRVFLRRGPGPAVEYDAEKLKFWTGYSYMYQEVLLNDKYDHSSLASPGAVMMVASKGGFIIVIVSTATGHVVSVTPKVGVYTFSADVARSEHSELCAKAAGRVKDSSVLRSLSDKAFTVKLVPMALHEATAARPPRKAATAAAALRKPQMDGDGTPAPSAAAAAVAEEDARAVADAAAARRANALKPPPK